MEHAHLFYAFFFALLGTLIVWIRRSKIKLVYPPGPKGFPLMGNIWDIPSTYEWLTYARWSQDFGMPTLLWANLNNVLRDVSFGLDSSEPRRHTLDSAQLT